MNPSRQQQDFNSSADDRQDSTASLASLMAPLQCAMKTVDGRVELCINGISMHHTLLLLADSGNAYTNLMIGFQNDSAQNSVAPSRADAQAINATDDMIDQIAWITLLDGAVEREDGQAMQRAWERGDCLLDADLRATTSVTRTSDGTLIFNSYDEELLLKVVGELLCDYVARQRGQAITSLNRPDAGLIHALLSISGTISIRPIETESYSTWIDIGINTCPNRSIGPADQCILYDTISNSWHGDV